MKTKGRTLGVLLMLPFCVIVLSTVFEAAIKKASPLIAVAGVIVSAVMFLCGWAIVSEGGE